ncbi:hypothetical protein GP486_000447 [Trichoglossum hirsutum]|uniref:HECT-type E3 ubiquitin transferase n=1 Tax=Trichoglossum hirsutum TaxID=265104 RepID=A0A9P8LIP2_9PEZI|nr:hypothetical protein GP486_000447 [Trichoglossum hirsutum]
MPVADIEHIRDDWPDLARGLTELLTWKDGDVGDTFLRTYEFSVEGWGTTLSVDMKTRKGNLVSSRNPAPDEKGPAECKTDGGAGLDASFSSSSSSFTQPLDASFSSSSSSFTQPLDTSTPPCSQPTGIVTPAESSTIEEAELVTNANREEYVRDYIAWLTDHSISAQYEAFARGFFVCLDRKSLSLFTPPTIRPLIEGTLDIDISVLEKFARYDDGYSPSHRVIKDFWSVVRQYSPEKKRQLLEFVTASDRVPVNGLESVTFVVQRNGPDSERVPTSLTCFGRLLLPEYSSRRKLKEKLKLALENGRGFGVP